MDVQAARGVRRRRSLIFHIAMLIPPRSQRFRTNSERVDKTVDKRVDKAVKEKKIGQALVAPDLFSGKTPLRGGSGNEGGELCYSSL